MADTTADVIIVGGGVIGLGIGWRCRQRGLDVKIIDPDPQAGAWRTAAGMLAPVTELHYGESDLLRLNLESATRYPAFAAELEQQTDVEIGYRPTGTLALAWDGADLGGLRDLHRFQRSLGLDAELLSGRELRQLEPALAPGLPGALLAAGDHSVDNRLLHKALLAANGPVRRQRAARVGAHEVELDDGNVMTAAHVVLAAGAWSAGLRPETSVRPVKGQTLRVRAPRDSLSRVVRATVKGSPVYLVPRADGTIVIGASSEEAGFDERPRAGAIYELLRDAQSILPGLSEAELIEVNTGFRPGSPDNAPLIGRAEDGLIIASGHYRNGILLTPVTADGIASLIFDGALPSHLEPFRPERFRTGVPA
jgi:glycine oxidase